MTISMYFLSDSELLFPSEPSSYRGTPGASEILSGTFLAIFVHLFVLRKDSCFHKSCLDLPPFCRASEIPNFCLLWRVNVTESCRVLEIKINLCLQVSKNIMSYNCVLQECFCKWHLPSCSCPSCLGKITGNKEAQQFLCLKIGY